MSSTHFRVAAKRPDRFAPQRLLKLFGQESLPFNDYKFQHIAMVMANSLQQLLKFLQKKLMATATFNKSILDC